MPGRFSAWTLARCSAIALEMRSDRFCWQSEVAKVGKGSADAGRRQPEIKRHLGLDLLDLLVRPPRANAEPMHARRCARPWDTNTMTQP